MAGFLPFFVCFIAFCSFLLFILDLLSQSDGLDCPPRTPIVSGLVLKAHKKTALA
jgi:hypothetical protein